MKRTVSIICFISFILTAVFQINVFAGELLKTDKTEYTECEPISVTAEGSGKDWVGIYLKTDKLGDDQAIRWYYVSQDGNKSGDTKDMRKAEKTNASRSKLASIPAGEYIIYLCENDGYGVIEQIPITVKEDTSPAAIPEAPSAVTYDRSAGEPGRADGVLKITVGEGAAPDRYIAYWAKNGKALEDYTAFAPIKYTGKTTKYQITVNTLIPNEADSIIVYAAKGNKVSEKYAEEMLPDGCNAYDPGDPVYEMQVISDIHLNSSTSHIHNKHFASALEQIKKLSPDSIGIFINGDIADHGEVAEYKTFNRMLENAGEGLPSVYCAIGNHDLSSGPYDTKLSNFLKYTEPGEDSVYYDLWLNGTHFIFLGSEATGLSAQLSSKQLNWFKEKLAENRDENRPIYVFLHQGIMDTVAGTFKYQGWHGINQSKKFSAIIKEYPEVVLFSGHSHWEMDSLNVMKARDESLPTIFSTAAVGYLWNDDATASDSGIEGAEGYFFYVYGDKIVARGRDFDSGKWIASAQFVVDYIGAGLEKEAGDPVGEKEEEKDVGTVGIPEKSNTGLVIGVVAGGLILVSAVIAAAVITKKKSRKA